MASLNIFSTRKPTKGRSERGVAEIAQFLPALYILFIVFLVPMIDLGFIFVAAATQYLATNDFAAKASTQTTFPLALNTMTGEAYKFQASGLAQFIRMVPGGGFIGCGNDMYLVATAIANGDVVVSSPNAPLTQQVDTTSRMYELQVKSTYSVAPLISLSSLPIFAAVPGLGQPVTLNFSANRPIERPGGYQATQSGSWVGQFPYFANSQTGTITGPTGQPNQWRTPTIFDQIKAAGQTVVSVNVIVVSASNSNYTDTGVSLQPGDMLWVDTQASGMWSLGSLARGYSPMDANGVAVNSGNNNGSVAYPAAGGSLAGRIGSATPFEVGNTLTNYPLNGTGKLQMIMNDWPNNYDDNTGSQMVRIIVVK